jgi:hypothetical protein
MSLAYDAGASNQDLFALGRRAAEARDAAFGRRATFVRSRQLLPVATLEGSPHHPATDSAGQSPAPSTRLATGAWRGPRDAAESYVEDADLSAVGGWAAAREAGVTLLVRRAVIPHDCAGARALVRVAFRLDESDAERERRVRDLVRDATVWGLLPTPDGEPYGLDTVRFVALCRLVVPASIHVVADVTALGPRLAQMCLQFGADELFAPIVAERALRLGANANNPALTRKEAVTLIRGAGLTAAERLAGDVVEEVAT